MPNVVMQKLQSAIDEYKAARAQYELARMEFELARERYLRTKDMAFEMMPLKERLESFELYADLQFLGENIGDAIRKIMVDACVRMCMDFVVGKSATYEPCLSVEDLVKALKDRGFEFKSATPGREVNAALMRLYGIKKKSTCYSLMEDAVSSILLAVKDGRLEINSAPLLTVDETKRLIALGWPEEA